MRQLLVAVFVAAIGAVALAQAPVEQGIGWPAEPCHTTFSSGSGPTFMKVCISATGNIQQFESPAGFEHIAIGDGVVEGYALCHLGFDPDDSSDDTAAIDGGSVDLGFENPTIHQPNGPNTFPLTITRTMGGHADAELILRQDFSRATAEKEVSITMRVTNPTGATIHGVALVRFFDGDFDNRWWDSRYANGADSVWGWSQHGLLLGDLTFTKFHSTHVADPRSYTTLFELADACRPEPDTFEQPGDGMGLIRYGFASISRGRSQTVKVNYRRF